MSNLQSTESSSQTPAFQHRRHWLGLPICVPVEGTVDQVLDVLPHFGRQPFAMASPNGNDIGVNPFLDMVYKVASCQGKHSVPVGVVSKNYRLVDHHQVLRTVQDVLSDNRVNPAEMLVRGEWTVNGERAHFSFILPAEERFTMRLQTDDEMRFRVEIFNSVDGTYRLVGVAGWLRFVCTNGLILGTALVHLREQHRQQLQLEELATLLGQAIHSAEMDKGTIKRWCSHSIVDRVLVDWVDEDVRECWGPKAAVRVLGIVRHGFDVEPLGSVRDTRPSQVRTKNLNRVPGVEAPVGQLFGVSQALSWMAGQRLEMAEDLEWRSQVPELIHKLAARG